MNLIDMKLEDLYFLCSKCSKLQKSFTSLYDHTSANIYRSRHEEAIQEIERRADLIPTDIVIFSIYQGTTIRFNA